MFFSRIKKYFLSKKCFCLVFIFENMLGASEVATNLYCNCVHLCIGKVALFALYIFGDFTWTTSNLLWNKICFWQLLCRYSCQIIVLNTSITDRVLRCYFYKKKKLRKLCTLSSVRSVSRPRICFFNWSWSSKTYWIQKNHNKR